jgi:hypothetical protein
MQPDFDRWLVKFFRNPPVAGSAVEEFEKAPGLHLPEEYVQFLKRTNGGQGFLGEGAYVDFWPLEEILRNNSECQAGEFAPGFLLIGSDGGGEAYAFDTRELPWAVGLLPFIPMEAKEFLKRGTSFLEFLESLYNERFEGDGG